MSVIRPRHKSRVTLLVEITWVPVCAVHGQQHGLEMGQSRTKRHIASDRFRAISPVALTSRRDIPEVINVGRKSRTRSVPTKEHLLLWTLIGFLSIMTRTVFNWRVLLLPEMVTWRPHLNLPSCHVLRNICIMHFLCSLLFIVRFIRVLEFLCFNSIKYRKKWELSYLLSLQM